MYEIKLRKKAFKQFWNLPETDRRITASRLSELRGTGAAGADRRLGIADSDQEDDETPYYVAVTSVSVIVFGVDEDDRLIVVYVIKGTVI